MDVGGSDGGDAGCRRFHLDRSKFRVLLCDEDPKSSHEILQLLYKCSYQVTTVRTARQVIDMLTTQGAEIDVVLADVNLLGARGLKMLKFIARKMNLRHIPIIMMSSQDEVSVIVKCLRLGAADYLLKPLRTNELLNLWTHTWRRRHTLGLGEKGIFGQYIEQVLSDPSDVNTNSTTLLSEDTDDKTRSARTEVNIVDQKAHESDTSAMKPVQSVLAEADVIRNADNTLNTRNADDTGRIFSWEKKVDLKVGKSSAFFTYVKSSAPASNSQFSNVHQAVTSPDVLSGQASLLVGGNTEGYSSKAIQENQFEGNLFQISELATNSCPFGACMELTMGHYSAPNAESLSTTEGHDSGMQPIFPVPVFLHGQSSFIQGFQGTLHDPHMQNAASFYPEYCALNRSCHVPVIQNLGYHPVGIRFSSGHEALEAHPWPYLPSSHAAQLKCDPMDRRAAALIKFRKKRKDRCYEKKIRYVNRKQLAEKRPRIRGQFVRQVNGVHVQLSDSLATKDYVSEEDGDEPICRELAIASSQRDASK